MDTNQRMLCCGAMVMYESYLYWRTKNWHITYCEQRHDRSCAARWLKINANFIIMIHTVCCHATMWSVEAEGQSLSVCLSVCVCCTSRNVRACVGGEGPSSSETPIWSPLHTPTHHSGRWQQPHMWHDTSIPLPHTHKHTHFHRALTDSSIHGGHTCGYIYYHRFSCTSKCWGWNNQTGLVQYVNTLSKLRQLSKW